MKSNKHIAVFIDRDGTISEEVGYLRNIENLNLIKGSADAVKLLNERGLKTAIVTNQSGVARGYFTEEFIHKTHERLKILLSEYDAFLDGIYYCPHHTDVGDEKYRKNCNCRKPNPGMIETAAEAMNIDIKKSYVVGDKVSDVQLAHNVGAKGILVLTGYGKGELQYFGNNGNQKPDYIAENLYDAVKWILGDIRTKT